MAGKMRKICGESVDSGKDAGEMRKRCGGWLDGGKDAEKMRRRVNGGDCGDAANARMAENLRRTCRWRRECG